MEPKIKVWVEQSGGVALSGYRVRLLRLVGETGSLAEAARRFGLSYRRAWGKIREMEHNLNVRLVESEPGGTGGGRSRLTAEGERLVELYPRFEAAAEADVRRDFDSVFGQQG